MTFWHFNENGQMLLLMVYSAPSIHLETFRKWFSLSILLDLNWVPKEEYNLSTTISQKELEK